ncbi:MAG: prolyl oligopeptidase family serine peptidase [Clostridia bacterium]|nr:prolyl oligopeptidase family serine peptidase [Clostridia bacterium]
MQRIEHREESWLFPFVEYSPQKKTGKMPMIVQLHGAGERGYGKDDLAAVDVHGFSEYIKDREVPCLFIMPQCAPETFWTAKIESLLDFIEQLKATYDIDEDRIYLTGISMGGYGTWTAAMAQPKTFAAIAPVCGAGMYWNAPAITMPVWVFHGVLDGAVKVENSDDIVAKLQELGREVRYTRLENVYHNAWDYAYNEELLTWLLSKRKEK